MISSFFASSNSCSAAHFLQNRSFLLTGSLLAESFLFIYIGVSSAGILLNSGPTFFSLISYELIFVEIMILGGCRFVVIFGFSLIMKLFFWKFWKLEFWDTLIVWFAGMIRGSIAFALITEAADMSPLLVPGVQGIVVFTTVILGSIMPLFMSLVGWIKGAPAPKPNEVQEEEPYNSVLEYKNRKIKGLVHRWVRCLDDKYVKPLLIYQFQKRENQIYSEKLKSKLFPSSEHAKEAEVVDGMGDMGLNEI